MQREHQSCIPGRYGTLERNKHTFLQVPWVFIFLGGCVSECWEVVGWRWFRERPLLYNISCVSKALPAMLPVVVRAELATVCLYVVLRERGG